MAKEIYVGIGAVQGTPLNYIASSGTQYIDTGFKPNNNTRVVMVADLNANPTTTQGLFGSRVSATSQNYALLYASSSSSFRSDYNNVYTQTWSIAPNGKRVYDKNKEKTTINGTSYSYTNTTFTGTNNMYLLAMNNNGTTQWQASAKLYACQIYDNGVLVRDYLPYLDTNGVPCLYDQVNRQFVYNSGTGSFSYQGLPSGYTKVDYIQSSGTQYIDTGFKPNQDTRVVMDVQYLSGNTASASALFGARTSTSSKAYGIQYNTSNGNLYHFYNAGYTNGITVSEKENRLVYYTDKNALTVGNITNTRTYAAFQCDYNMYLLALNSAGTASFQMYAKLYACQVYDNDELIRSFVPCKNSSDVLGLYDYVNDVFYENAGTGSFTTGEASAVAQKVASLYGGVAGVARTITKGYAGVSGVARQFWSSGTPVSDLSVGDSIYIECALHSYTNEWLIVHKGNPDSTIYDSSCDGIWIMQRNFNVGLYASSVFGTDANYSNSSLHSMLKSYIWYMEDPNSSGYYSGTNPSLAKCVKKVKIPYDSDIATNETVLTNIETYAFAPSMAELGFNNWSDGAELDYFKDAYGYTGSEELRVAYDVYNGYAASYWHTRTPWGSDYSYLITPEGSYQSASVSAGPYHVRPIMILYPNATIDDSFRLIY